MTKGLAILFMVMLHLFCINENVPYECLEFSDGTPIIYYLGVLSDCCVAIYCFCSGYAVQLICEKTVSAKNYYKSRFKSILKLLMNYWIVLIIFSIIGLITNSADIPVSAREFILNVFLLSKSYNGAWWFVLTYIFLIVLSRPLYFVIKHINPIVVNIVVILFYIAAYILRFKKIINFESPVFEWCVNQIALIGTSLLPFLWGMYFYKYKFFTKIRSFTLNYLKNWQVTILSLFIVLLITILHGIFQSLIVAPITGLIILVLFNAADKKRIGNALFGFLGEHSTNIWLTHMFFYAKLFTDFVFIAKYPIFILLLMLVVTIACSYVINFIYKPISGLVK